jgi:hypothetical protein
VSAICSQGIVILKGVVQPHQEIVIFQVQSKLSLLTVFILVQETRVSCLVNNSVSTSEAV